MYKTVLISISKLLCLRKFIKIETNSNFIDYHNKLYILKCEPNVKPTKDTIVL